MKKALATFVIGDEFKEFYKRFRASHVRYCVRFNWDLIEMTEPLDENFDKKSIIAQKVLVGTFEKYETVVWIDSDIWITDNCPEIETNDPTKIGVCRHTIYGVESLQKYVNTCRCWEGDYYKSYGFENGIPEINAGLMVFHPRFHSEYLKETYRGLVDFISKVPTNDPVTGVLLHYDQPYIGHKFFVDNMYEVLDWRHNCIWPVYRCILAEPYMNQIELIRPMKTLMNYSYSIHLTDREDIDVLEFVKNMESKDIILSQDHIDKGILFDPIFRLHEHNIKVPEGTQLKFPTGQYGFVKPKNITSYK